MKVLAVKSTVLPTGERLEWVNGMPKHPTFYLDSQLFNRWANYIHNQNVKLKGWHLNKPRKGGIGYVEQQEKVLEAFKEMLK
jgi:hypothetical protein